MNKLLVFLTSLILAGFVFTTQAEPPAIYPPGIDRPVPPSVGGYRYSGRIRIEKNRNEAGYQLRIHTGGDLDPDSIQVTIQGRSILIENDRSYQREERNERGSYSYARSSSTFRRRLSIPRNANAENMQRSVEDGVLIITLPYLNGYR